MPKIPAVFIRGGTSKGVFFHAKDLPESTEQRDALFLQVLGSPDPYRRQLDGLGGGVSSLSKVVIIAPSARAYSDVDYTFAQVAVDQPVVDYGQTCGNLSAAVGPFAVDEGILSPPDGMTSVRVFNTNTGKGYVAHFEVRDGQTVESGTFTIAGVGGCGARVQLDYLDPAGAGTAGFLPSGNVVDELSADSAGKIPVSLIDATAPSVFVTAERLGIDGHESPDELQAKTELLRRLDVIRRRCAVRMGMAGSIEAVPVATPKIAIVAPPARYRGLNGEVVEAEQYDISARVVSMEQMHKAIPASAAMCLAAATRVTHSLPSLVATADDANQPIRIGTPSGVLPVSAKVARDSAGNWRVESTTLYRTQRRLMEGWVCLPD